MKASSHRYTGQRMSSAHVRTALRVAFLLAMTVSGVAAQDDEPIGRYVIDVRGSMVNLGRNDELARVRRLRANQLPSRGTAIDLGGHFYFLRLGPVTFGLGASILSAAAQQPVVEPTADDPTPGFPQFTPQQPAQDDEELEPVIEGLPVTSRFTAISPQITFNFGHRNGWSYVGGGLGTSRLNVYPQQPATPGAAGRPHPQLRRGGPVVPHPERGAVAGSAVLRHQPRGAVRRAARIAAPDPDGGQHRRLRAMSAPGSVR